MKIMRFRLSKSLLLTLSISLIGGVAVLLFILLGPPQLLAKSESADFCASCHVMEDQHTAWQNSGAHRRIRCVDCHGCPLPLEIHRRNEGCGLFLFRKCAGNDFPV